MRFPYLCSKVQSELYLLIYVVFYVLKAGFAAKQVMPATGILQRVQGERRETTSTLSIEFRCNVADTKNASGVVFSKNGKKPTPFHLQN